MIPFVNLQIQHEGFLREYFRDLQKLFSTTEFIGAAGGISSKTVAAFEDEFAKYLGVKHVIGVNSGTDALLLGLDGLGVKPGDEVITSVFSFMATADVIVRLGAKPVFVDIEPVTCNLNPALVQAAITDRTRVIIPVHLYGQAADMGAIMDLAQKHNLGVVEDVAQACGAEWSGKKLGSIGHCGAFSFYPTKNLGGAGDAGAITTDDDELADRLRSFRDHGRAKSGAFEAIGYNSRLDPIQALYLHHKLPDLDDMILDRQENARLYAQLFQGTEVTRPTVPDDNSHSFNLYTIQVRDRKRLQAYLKEKEIGSAVYYSEPMHLTPAMEHLGYGRGSFPVAEDVAGHCLSVPVWPGLKKRDIERVVGVVNEFLENNVPMELRS
jgi:dTDP-4-amino-4,6-dideoxygalactose transaminase